MNLALLLKGEADLKQHHDKRKKKTDEKHLFCLSFAREIDFIKLQSNIFPASRKSGGPVRFIMKF